MNRLTSEETLDAMHGNRSKNEPIMTQDGFDFPTNAVVTEAVISGFDKNGILKSEKINGPILSPEAKKIISSLGVGKRAFIEEIKVRINGKQTTAPDVIIKRKG